jgi:hypothetical protein
VKLSAQGALPLFGAAGRGEPPVRVRAARRRPARVLDRELPQAADSPSLLVSLDGKLRAGAVLAAVSAGAG